MQRRRAATAERRDSDGAPADLYRQDFHAWASEQAQALHRAGETRADGDAKAFREAAAALDYENLSEELASLGRSELRELRHRLTTVVEHLLKSQFSPATEPRAGWWNTVQRSRIDVARLLEDSPSLKPQLPLSLNKAKLDAVALVPAELASRDAGNTGELARTMREALHDYTPDRVQDRDWWPGDPLTDALADAIGAYSARFPGQGLPFERPASSPSGQVVTLKMLRAAVEAGEPLDEQALLDELGLRPPPEAPA